MPAIETVQKPEHFDAPSRANWPILLGIATAVTLVHLLTNGRYGFHRDELQFLSDARHLDWGFVAYPPLTPFLERISLGLFGLSLVGLRLFSVLAQVAAIVVTGLMAHELAAGGWPNSPLLWRSRFRRCRSFKARNSNIRPSITCGGC